MKAPAALILRAPGTNCDVETEHAFRRAGALTQRWHINQLLEQVPRLAEFQIFCLPGGFSFGDDIAAGRILAKKLSGVLGDALQRFRDDGKLILGICNGFQVLLRSPLILTENVGDGAIATLCWNQVGRFEDRWVRLKVSGSRSIFLRDLDQLYLPVAHAEGRLAVRDAQSLTVLRERQHVALRYGHAEGTGDVSYPANPNGSVDSIAALSDESGHVMGMMPHPERYLDRLQHPRWTRGEGTQPGDGFHLFRNAVEYFMAS